MFQGTYNLKDVEKCFKPYNYYKSLSEDDETSISTIKHKRTLDDLFVQESEPKRKKVILPSTVARSIKEGTINYISSNKNDGEESDLMIKIEVYNLKKIKEIPTSQQWKNADIRIKYYTKNNSDTNNQIKSIVYNITKEISETDSVKHYSFKI